MKIYEGKLICPKRDEGNRAWKIIHVNPDKSFIASLPTGESLQLTEHEVWEIEDICMAYVMDKINKGQAVFPLG